MEWNYRFRQALCERHSYSRSKNQIQQRIARKSSRIQRKHVLQTKRGNHQPQGNLGSSQHWGKLVQALSILFQIRKTIPRNEKKWTTIHANPKRGSDLAIFICKTVTTMLRHFDQDERESDGSRHWEAIQSVLMRKFERDGFHYFNDEVWLQKI